tara:strand:+ start:61 stop:558 length:498 start_codon:yes stop_codon:yes gene_type:complete
MTTSTMTTSNNYYSYSHNNCNKNIYNNRVDVANKNVLNIINNLKNNNCLNYPVETMKQMLLTLVYQVEKLFIRVNELENQVQKLRNTTKHNYNLRQENQQLRYQLVDFQEKITQDDICCVCMTNARTHINIQCGHMSVCETCSYHIREKCPICRANGNFIKVIVS